MTILRNRLSKLESESGVNVTIEDILKVLHDRKQGIDCEAEWRRIQASKTWIALKQLNEKLQ